MENLTELKSRLFDAYLHLPEAPDWHDFQGLIAAALPCEMDPSLPQILFKGTPDLALLELNRHIDKKIFESFDQNLLESMKTHEKVQATLEKKIRFFSDHLPKTLSILKYGRHPFRASLLLRMQGETVTSIWYFAGDTASDFNYYSKRFLLGSIYRATFIYWLKRMDNGLFIPDLLKVWEILKSY